MRHKKPKADPKKWGDSRFEDEWVGADFITFPVAILFDDKITVGAKVTYGALCFHTRRNGKVPAHDILARELSGGARTIGAYLLELEKAGYIVRVRRPGWPNEYIIKALGRGRINLADPID